MFSDANHKFLPLMSSAAGSSLLPPEHLISPLALTNDNNTQVILTLNLDSIMEKRAVYDVAGVLTSYGNQRPIPKITTVTSISPGKLLADVCLEVPSPISEEPLSPLSREDILMAPPTDDDSPTRSTNAYYSLPPEDHKDKNPGPASIEHFPVAQYSNAKDARRASIEHLHLGPLAEEGVNILVESDGIIRSLLVHTELLCHFSPYFRSFFGKREPKVFTKEVRSLNYIDELDFDRNAEVKAKEDGSIKLDIKVKFPTARTQHGFRLDDAIGDVRHNVFATFVDWLYLGPGQFEPKDVTVTNQLLIQLWVFAGRLGIPSCQNDCIAAIEENRKRNRTIATSMLGWIYNNTRDYGKTQCGVKNLLIDQCALALDEKWLLQGMQQPGFAEQFPTECLFDIIIRMRVLLRESGLGEISLVISPTSRRYWIDDGEGRAV
jgi:hypothetical protein